MIRCTVVPSGMKMNGAEGAEMDRLTSLFNSPLFLGFDHFERLIDTMSKVFFQFFYFFCTVSEVFFVPLQQT